MHAAVVAAAVASFAAETLGAVDRADESDAAVPLRLDFEATESFDPDRLVEDGRPFLGRVAAEGERPST